jgi:hypothetical protein
MKDNKIKNSSFPMVITLDEMELVNEWRKMKLQKYGSLTICLCSGGTEYVMDIGNKKKGKVA